ncbi:hypothetical protein WMY93_030588 [Mugilogobius chulae]|uniref:Uncharacterized protein n=1 Tax=Mugilogobius chulae TaxID=88201 RepID=A0AAW0MI59_9GOBI
MRIARWSARLLCFDYSVVYRPGSQNYTADCLSRLPLPMSADIASDTEPEMVAQISATLASLPVVEFDTACANCPELSALRAQIQKGWPATIKALNDTLVPYYKLKDELSTKDNYILRGSRLIAPLSLRHSLIALAHESHQGIVRTKQRPEGPLLVAWNRCPACQCEREKEDAAQREQRQKPMRGPRRSGMCAEDGPGARDENANTRTARFTLAETLGEQSCTFTVEYLVVER